MNGIIRIKIVQLLLLFFLLSSSFFPCLPPIHLLVNIKFKEKLNNFLVSKKKEHKNDLTRVEEEDDGEDVDTHQPAEGGSTESLILIKISLGLYRARIVFTTPYFFTLLFSSLFLRENKTKEEKK